MDLAALKDKLGDDFAALETYINDLTGQRDAARKESVEGRKALKAKAETAEALNRQLMEKLGIETVEELDALPPAKGQAEALKQLETRLKAKDTALAEKETALQALSQKYRDSQAQTQLDQALATYEFIDRDLVAAHLRGQLTWQDEQLRFTTEKGAVPLTEGVKTFVEAMPDVVKCSGARVSGYNPSARGAEVKNPWAKDSFNLTEQLRLVADNPTLAAQLKTQAGIV